MPISRVAEILALDEIIQKSGQTLTPECAYEKFDELTKALYDRHAASGKPRSIEKCTDEAWLMAPGLRLAIEGISIQVED